ncbi:hypothetical protein MMC32_000999 [Xylographa parallela]|nr:hypothetical protein [Xylographa parallela]
MDVPVDDYVFHSYDPGFIVLSYIVSVVGCWTSLELLHKRTSSKGLYNWYLLLGAATAMGAVAIWSMHFIGNRAITMDEGQPDMQIGYNAAFTAGSFFLPICVVGLAFYLFTISEQVSFTGTITGGCLAGFAICGMHYLGQGGISNYHAVYDWRFVLGSGIIAVVAATLALGIFFYFKSGWTNTWWKRSACALLLAVGVSGMHWVATVGTSYRLESVIDGNRNGLSRRTTVVVVLCLAIGCCITLVIFAIIGQRNRHRMADRAQQVVLACATWDQDGRLLVTPEGLLPCRKITNSYVERSFDDIFSTEHPVFCWIYRASRYWQSVADLIPGMRIHLRSSSFAKRSRPGSATQTRDSPDGTEDYSQVFKELFCIAASDLATLLQEPLENLGVLYDEIVSTGTTKKSRSARVFSSSQTGTGSNDIERAPSRIIFGRGQLLFLVRRVDKLETAQLQASGFRFAPVPQVVEHLARSMQVTVKELQPRLDRMKEFPPHVRTLDPGVHLACFALRPLYQRGFDVLVPKDAKNLLPTVALPIPALDMWQIDFITRFDDWEVGKCLQWLSKQSILESATARERVFFGQLYNGLFALGQQINDEFFQTARLTARPLRAPCYNPETGMHGQAEIIAFRAIADVHQSRLLNDRVEFTSSRFFLCQQHVYQKSPDHQIFARRVHREFASLLERKERPSLPRASSSHYRRGFFGRMPSSPAVPTASTYSGQWDHSPSPIKEDSSSEKGLVDEPTSGPFGGIHVSNEVTIDVSEVRRGDRSPNVEMSNLGVFSEATVAPVERETFIDELISLTIAERRQQRA